MDFPFLRVPPAHRESIVLIDQLAPAEFDELRGSLEAAEPFSGVADLTERAAATKRLGETEAGAVVLALFSLYTQLKFHGWTAAELASGVSCSPDLPETPDDASQLADRLQALLELDSITTTGRALDLLTEHEHVFHSARVLTDIRPVFGDDPGESPNGALVVESLKLEYFDEGSTCSLYLALSHGDLRNLRDTIDRALGKSETVQGLLGQIGLPHFDAESDS